MSPITATSHHPSFIVTSQLPVTIYYSPVTNHSHQLPSTSRRIYTLPFDLNNSMDKSWMKTSRTKKQYIDEVEAFIKYAVHNLQKTRNIDPRDFNMDFGLEILTHDSATVEMVNATKESFDEDDLAKFQELLLDAKKPLYKGCPDVTKLFAIVKLLNLKGKYGASNKFFTELLGLLKKMLPAEPLADDLHTIYETGVDTYDASTKENFNMCVVVLWTINNYLALEKNVGESLVRTLLNVPRKTKDEMNARLDLEELGIKPELFARQEEDKTTLPPAGYTLTNAEKDIFCETLCNITVEKELAISKDSVSETVRWISYGPRATIVKYEAYNINGYTFHTKSNDGIVYHNSGVSVEAVDLYISKEVATTRKSFIMGFYKRYGY
nr:hypothetical protein [Tanacetum cinerariifolium]